MTQASKRSVKPQPMTDEQRAAAIYRSVAQRLESTAQGVLFNLVSNPQAINLSAEEVAQRSLDVAKEFVTRTPKVIEELIAGIATKEPEKEA